MEMAQSSETEPIFTINDFPMELIERFAPDLRSRTVSNLRLVSPRFCDVFTSDRYYRSYLSYGNRLEFYCDDLEDFDEAQYRWRHCLEAEKLRLDKWRHGRATKVHSLQIPRDVQPSFTSCGYKFIQWHGAVGEGNNYWMMCQLNHGKLLLANVTKDPIMTVVDVSQYRPKCYDFAHLLSDQIVINGGNGERLVFDILSKGSNLALKHIFTIESEGNTEAYVSGMSSVTQSYRNLYTIQNQDNVLKVWDLKRSVPPDNLILKELLPPSRAAELDEPNWGDLLGTEFPYILVTIEARNKPVLYLAVNLEEKRAVCCIAYEAVFDLNQWLVKGHELFMELWNKMEWAAEVRIYDLRPRTHRARKPDCCPVFLETRLLFLQTLQGHTDSVGYEPPWLISSVEGCFQKITLMRVDGSGLMNEINELESIEFRALVGPFLLLEYSHPSLIEEDRLLTWSMDGDQVFDWVGMIRDQFDEVRDLCLPRLSNLLSPRFRSLSKCIVQNVRGDTLYICHF